MRFQFLRLYLLIILIACVVVYSFSEIYDQFYPSEQNYQIDIKHFFSLASKSEFKSSMKLVRKKNVSLPVTLEELLQHGHIIKLVDIDLSEFYYQNADRYNYYQFGPFTSSKKVTDDSELYLILLFYSALALLLLAFIWPLFNELAKLQEKALSFGKHLKPFNNNLRVSSSIYPLANTFDKMSHQIVESMRMHQDLSRTIAHEIHTPLARMKFVTELISSDIEEEHKYRLKADIDEIQQLMAEYLSFERLDHEHYSMEKKQCDVPSFVKKLSEKYQYQNKSQEIEIKFTYNNNTAFFNEHAINRALQNLINNALRYAKSVIEVEFSIDDDFCKITISDDGIGVGNEAKKLIQPFVRKISNDSTDNGFGLGLYIVRKILIWHQGSLTLDNCVVLHGARVTLAWPNEA
jgi:two-component system OmpR family sensor kinase